MSVIMYVTGGYTLVDEEDVVIVQQWKWHVQPDRYTSYIVRTSRINDKRVKVSLHTEIIIKMGLIIPNGYEVDHIDRNGLNNTRENFRVVTKSINAHNSDLQINNTSGKQGVYWSKEKQKWEARMHFNKVNIQLGTFSDIKDAIKARIEAEIKFNVHNS